MNFSRADIEYASRNITHKKSSLDDAKAAVGRMLLEYEGYKNIYRTIKYAEENILRLTKRKDKILKRLDKHETVEIPRMRSNISKALWGYKVSDPNYVKGRLDRELVTIIADLKMYNKSLEYNEKIAKNMTKHIFKALETKYLELNKSWRINNGYHEVNNYCVRLLKKNNKSYNRELAMKIVYKFMTVTKLELEESIELLKLNFSKTLFEV